MMILFQFFNLKFFDEEYADSSSVLPMLLAVRLLWL